MYTDGRVNPYRQFDISSFRCFCFQITEAIKLSHAGGDPSGHKKINTYTPGWLVGWLGLWGSGGQLQSTMVVHLGKASHKWSFRQMAKWRGSWIIQILNCIYANADARRFSPLAVAPVREKEARSWKPGEPRDSGVSHGSWGNPAARGQCICNLMRRKLRVFALMHNLYASTLSSAQKGVSFLSRQISKTLLIRKTTPTPRPKISEMEAKWFSDLQDINLSQPALLWATCSPGQLFGNLCASPTADVFPPLSSRSRSRNLQIYCPETFIACKNMYGPR